MAKKSNETSPSNKPTNSQLGSKKKKRHDENEPKDKAAGGVMKSEPKKR